MPVDDDLTEEIPMTPEEQKVRDKLMRHCYKLMADAKAFPSLEKMLQRDPLNAIADATVTIIERLEKDLGEQDPEILLDLLSEIIPQLAELAAGMGTDIPEDQLEQVAALAIGKWSEAHPERVDREGLGTMGQATMQALGTGAQPAQQPAPQQFPPAAAPAAPFQQAVPEGLNG